MQDLGGAWVLLLLLSVPVSQDRARVALDFHDTTSWNQHKAYRQRYRCDFAKRLGVRTELSQRCLDHPHPPALSVQGRDRVRS